MAKFNFNDKNYSIEDAILADARIALQNKLVAINGTGDTIKFDGTNYNVDAAKLGAARDIFTGYLTSTLSGTGMKVKINGVEYSLGANKLQDDITKLTSSFTKLESGELVTTVNIAGTLLTTTSSNPVLCYSKEDEEFASAKIYFEGEEENAISEWWMFYSDYIYPLLGAPTLSETGVALTAGETYYYTYCTSDPNFAVLVIQNDVKTWVTDSAGDFNVTWNSEQSVNMQNTEFTTSTSFLGISVINDPEDLYIPYGTDRNIGRGTPEYFVYYLMER